MAEKSANAYRTISEVAEEVGVPQHVLRFWETKFTAVKPLKRSGNRRYYKPEDVAILKTIRTLLHDEGFTIKGVQKQFRDNGLRATVDSYQEDTISSASVPKAPDSLSSGEQRQLSPILHGSQGLREILSELKAIRAGLAGSNTD